MEFDLQKFLSEMRSEQLAAHTRLSDKVDAGFTAMTSRAEKIATDLVSHEKADTETQQNIDKRLQKVEGLASTVSWITRLGLAAIFTLIVDLIRNHIPNFLAGK